MAVRRKATKGDDFAGVLKEVSDTDAADTADAASDDDTDDEIEEKEVKKGKKEKKEKKGEEQKVMKKKAAGLNYAAISFLLMMVLPALITLGLQAYDMMYPKLAEARMIRGKIQKCYDQAKPNEVVDIDKIMKKYAGKETALFNSLRNKYGKHAACH